MQDILINWTPQETRVAIVEHNTVQELHIERTLERGLVGNIYNAKVVRVLPGMQSAFLDIGLERAAFLHVADVHVPGTSRAARGPGVAPPTPIEKLMFQGQTLVAQVIKDPIGSKGARLSTQVSIAGRLLVFLPQDDHIGISQKIGSHEVREQLRARVQALAQTIDASLGGGFILRTNAEEASDEALADDIRYLRTTWSALQERISRSPPGTLLFQDLNLAQRVLRDMVHDQTAHIRVDSKQQFEALKQFGQTYTPSAVGCLTLYQDERPLFDLFNIDEEIARALARRVALKSGGHIIIDQTEALTTIDVNTGGYVGAHNFDETIFKTNLEAAQTIARQLRLRNLGGIIVIDFIDMTREDHRSAVLSELRTQLASDRTKVSISGFTQLGLVEMTRKRTRESLAHILCETCPTCDGKGQVNTARSICYDILREVLRQARQFQPQEFRVVASPLIVEMLRGEESQHLAALSEFIAKPISLQVQTSGAAEVFDIVLMS